jgi:hypothetical protein
VSGWQLMLFVLLLGKVLRGNFYNEKVDVFSFAVLFWELHKHAPAIAYVSQTGEAATDLREGPGKGPAACTVVHAS